MNCPNCHKDTSVHLWQDENSCFCSYCFYRWNVRQQTEIERLKARLAQYERESAEENSCELHPKTTMFYGCLECNKALKAQAAIAEERLKDCEKALTFCRNRLIDSITDEASSKVDFAACEMGRQYFKKWGGK
jgi:hypothetical protein